MNLFKRFFLRLFIVSISILFLVGCDQASKKAAHLELKDRAEIAGIINLHFVENDGGMLNIGSKLPQEIKFVVFILIVSVFLVLLFFYIVKNKRETFIKLFALVFILSGGLGNLIDRILNNGKVIDFIRIRLPLIEGCIFNIADFYVATGFLILILSYFIKKKVVIKENSI
jgi:signal peptidase II